MSDTIGLLAHRSPSEVVARRGARAILGGEFLGDVQRTAMGLREGGYAINLCNDRYAFAVALCAALWRRATTLLPPSAAPAVLQQLLGSYDVATVFSDDAPEGPSSAAGGASTIAPSVGAGAWVERGPEIDAAHPAVIAFTSGSTGAPTPQVKTWGSLSRGAVEEAEGLGLAGMKDATLIGTVPPQHMYGLESTVLLALRGGLALHAARPLYPADIRDVLCGTPGRRVLVTTPVHLRALVAAGLDMPPLHLVVCATAPLPSDLGIAAEELFAAPLCEIYGFTEAGMVATRRSTVEACWHTLPGLVVREVDGKVRFRGGHVAGEVGPTDRLQVLDEHTFLLHGRGEDLVNVAGKRASLAHLNEVLNSLPGVQDGVYLIPEETGDALVTRPMAFVVAPGRTREQLLAALRERLDPVFLPRPLHLVDRLPRNDTGKLPRSALLALADRLDAAPPPKAFKLSFDDPIAQGHFPGNPVVPGAVLLDVVLRQAEAHLGLPQKAWQIDLAKFFRPVRPGDEVEVVLAGDSNEKLAFECRVGAETVASGRVQVLSRARQ